MPADLRTPFLEAGLQIIGERGYAGLKQAAVCAALGVTTGSFYHSFANWKDYTSQLLDFWQRERTTNLIALAESEPDPVARLRMLIEVSLQLPHRAEAAIRVWSALDADVAAVQAAVDRQRFDVIHAAFQHLVEDAAATAYAHTGVALLVGFEQQPEMDTQTLRWSLELLLQTAHDRAAATPPP